MCEVAGSVVPEAFVDRAGAWQGPRLGKSQAQFPLYTLPNILYQREGRIGRRNDHTTKGYLRHLTFELDAMP